VLGSMLVVLFTSATQELGAVEASLRRRPAQLRSWSGELRVAAIRDKLAAEDDFELDASDMLSLASLLPPRPPPGAPSTQLGGPPEVAADSQGGGLAAAPAAAVRRDT
jgi:hypothetical protein